MRPEDDEPSTRPNEFDMPSGTIGRVWNRQLGMFMKEPDPEVPGKSRYITRELNFRELHDTCAHDGDLATMDRVSPALRLRMQRSMDPNYRPFDPNAPPRKVGRVK
jgi:hypothetical protein